MNIYTIVEGSYEGMSTLEKRKKETLRPSTSDGMSDRTRQALEQLEQLKIENAALKTSKSDKAGPLRHSTPDAPHGMSDRTRQVLEQLERVERENAALKASKSEKGGTLRPTSDAPADMSDRTRQALEQLERVKRENAALKASKSEKVGTLGPTSDAPADMSDRTRQVLEQLERVKRENAALKASKSEKGGTLRPTSDAPADMSDRTRQALEQLERVKRENAALKASKSDKADSKDKRIAYLERNHDAATKARMEEIHNMIVTSQESDLVFLVDSTGSMEKSINMIKDRVGDMVTGIKNQYPKCKIRVAFAPYKDYEDAEDDSCDFTTSFAGPDSKFKRALSRVRASGGGDQAEDVFTGIDKVAAFDWQAPNRLIIHIADAPCHGTRFHDGVSDRYPYGDKYGRTVEEQMQKLINCKVSAYLFCHLNRTTRKMVQEFKKAARGKLNIMEDQFSNISAIPDKVVALVRTSIQLSMSGVGKARRDTKHVNEVVVTAIPSWSNRTLTTASHFKHTTYPELDTLLSIIARRMPIDEKDLTNVQIEIAKSPFTAEGAMRWPYYARITHLSEAPRFMVLKRFKTPLGKDVRAVHNRDKYLAQMEVQSVAAQMAKEFNKRTMSLKNVKKVEFTEVTTVEVGSGPASKFYNMEEKLEGNWVRFSNNAAYVNEEDYVAVLQAFTHWTYQRSGGLLMVNDLQGIRMNDKYGRSMFLLCDPAIHCTDVLRFTGTNLGPYGFKLFLDTHKCNDVCKHLELTVGKAGYTPEGTKCTY